MSKTRVDLKGLFLQKLAERTTGLQMELLLLGAGNFADGASKMRNELQSSSKSSLTQQNKHTTFAHENEPVAPTQNDENNNFSITVS